MNNRLWQYQMLLEQMLILRDRKSEDAEEQVLDQMDRVWMQLTETERASADDLVARVVRGEITTEALRYVTGLSQQPGLIRQQSREESIISPYGGRSYAIRSGAESCRYLAA